MAKGGCSRDDLDQLGHQTGHFIDRGHFVIEQLLRDKACVTIATGENYGSRDARKVLDKLVIYSGGLLCDSFAMNAPFNGTDMVREELSEKCRRTTRKIMKGLQKKSFQPIQKMIHFVVLNAGIRPLVRKKERCIRALLISGERWRYSYEDTYIGSDTGA